MYKSILIALLNYTHFTAIKTEKEFHRLSLEDRHICNCFYSKQKTVEIRRFFILCSVLLYRFFSNSPMQEILPLSYVPALLLPPWKEFFALLS